MEPIEIHINEKQLCLDRQRRRQALIDLCQAVAEDFQLWEWLVTLDWLTMKMLIDAMRNYVPQLGQLPDRDITIVARAFLCLMGDGLNHEGLLKSQSTIMPPLELLAEVRGVLGDLSHRRLTPLAFINAVKNFNAQSWADSPAAACWAAAHSQPTSPYMNVPPHCREIAKQLIDGACVVQQVNYRYPWHEASYEDHPWQPFDGKWKNHMVYKVVPRVTTVDWRQVSDKFNHIATSEDGSVGLFMSMPWQDEDENDDGNLVRFWKDPHPDAFGKSPPDATVIASLVPGDMPWAESAIHRPKDPPIKYHEYDSE